MKRVVRVVLGISLWLVLAQLVRRELSQFSREAKNGFLAKNSAEEFWHWLTNVMEEYAGLNAYIRDRQSFGNDVWENGMTEHSFRLLRKLGGHFNHTDYVDCNQAIEEATKATHELIDLLKARRRQGVAEKSEEIGRVLENILEMGEERRTILIRR